MSWRKKLTSWKRRLVKKVELEKVEFGLGKVELEKVEFEKVEFKLTPRAKSRIQK